MASSKRNFRGPLCAERQALQKAPQSNNGDAAANDSTCTDGCDIVAFDLVELDEAIWQ
jgi:hypothetical protein